MRTSLLVLCAFLLAACASTEPDHPIAESVDMKSADFGPYPENYEALVKGWASANLKDPESARFGHISRPRKEWMVENLKTFYGFSTCAEINAKNSYGGYVGAQTFWFFIRDGKIERAQNTTGFPGPMISRDHFVNCEDGSQNG